MPLNRTPSSGRSARPARKSHRPVTARLRVEELEKRELLDTSGLLSRPKIVEQGVPPPTFDQSPFITGLYFDFLHRQPQPAEVAGWSAALNSGMSRAQVATGFL